MIASSGRRAVSITRLFEETRTNPLWVTGHVAQPPRFGFSNQARAEM
jgi:hypothetical protein